MSLTKYKIWDGQTMVADMTSDIVWTDGDDVSAQFISAGGAGQTRAGTLFVDGTDDDEAELNKDWTTIVNQPVLATVAVNLLVPVVDRPVNGIRLRWEPTGPGLVGALKATVCVHRVAEE